MKIAKKITLKSLLNAYLKNNHSYKVRKVDDIHYIDIYLKFAKATLIVELSYYSTIGRHQFKFPLQILANGASESSEIGFWTAIEVLVYGLTDNNKVLNANTNKLIQQIRNSYKNLNLTFSELSKNEITELFTKKVNFKMSEGGLLAGHQMHPSPKSCQGFSNEEFCAYYPELRNKFQMHYFLASPKNAVSSSNLSQSTNDLLKKYFLDDKTYAEGVLIPVHPWQAQHLQKLDSIKQMIVNKTLVDLGPQGKYFTATSSVRSVYSEDIPYMLKLSLNVMITNSVRMQYVRELSRALSVGKFWEGEIASELRQKYPAFNAITDPAFICLHENGKMIEESAVLFRTNPFTDNDNNVTCLASLCQDDPLNRGNRFNSMIPQLKVKYILSGKDAALLWFKQFLSVCIEPLLWLFSHYEIALEAHQQNLLIYLDKDGLPQNGYFRDSQGYYISHTALNKLHNNSEIFNDFAQGSSEFISHHFSYYLVCNSIFGVINALGYSGFIPESDLIKAFQQFIFKKNQAWDTKINNYLNSLLYNPTLPFKDNLATKLYDLDELTAPLELQSVYTNIANPFNLLLDFSTL